jgi:hypothetical protein
MAPEPSRAEGVARPVGANETTARAASGLCTRVQPLPADSWLWARGEAAEQGGAGGRRQPVT